MTSSAAIDRAELDSVAQGFPGDALEYVRWWPIALGIQSSDRDVLEWAHHHLATTSGPHRGDENPLRIRAMADTRLTSRLRTELAAHPTEQFFPYRGDPWESGHIAGCRAWASRRAAPGLVVVEAVPGRLLLLAGTDSRAVARGTVRLAREALRTELAARGAVTLHASFAAGEFLGGTIFAGPSGSGKTTLAIALARSGALVSGDQTEVLGSLRGVPAGVGFPWAISVSGHALRSAGIDIDLDQRTLMRRPSAEKLELTYVEASELLGIRTTTDLSIDVVVAIEPATADDVPAAVASDLAACRDVLEGEIREPDPAFPSFWLAAEHVSNRAYADLADALRGARVVRLAWDPARHTATDALAAIGECG